MDGPAVSYLELPSGVPVYASDGARVGTVHKALGHGREHLFDGLIVRHEDGRLRWVDAPEVERLTETGVTLRIDAAAVAALGEPEYGVGFHPLRSLRRLLGR